MCHPQTYIEAKVDRLVSQQPVHAMYPTAKTTFSILKSPALPNDTCLCNTLQASDYLAWRRAFSLIAATV